MVWPKRQQKIVRTKLVAKNRCKIFGKKEKENVWPKKQ